MESMVPVSGGEIWAEDTGGDGTPLVLVHPDWGNADIWSQLSGLLSRHHRVIRYDNRGHGRSPAAAAGYEKIGDLRAVLDQADVGSAIIVGHSGGGGTALALALSEPERVASLVLIAPGLPDYPWPEDDPYTVAFTRLFGARDSDGLVSLGLATWAPAGHDGAARSQITSAVSTFLADRDLEVPPPPAYDRLGKVVAPTVMVRGDREYPMVADCSDLIAARIPGSRQIVIPGADHLLPLRVPARLAEIITERASEPGAAGH
jgi:3-oxoadipate enol-lactonase